MKTVNIHETKTNLSAILKEVEETGDKFLICRNGKPVAEIIPHQKKNRLSTDAFLSQVKIKCNLTEPLTEDEWNG